ncbi:unnamed protein product [Brassicogethes aeneus]|uniref:Deoxynucleoside kinase domain-containing protein n=1 Tax=Brassicogethes aeneus TaxID=1431903 RepID=A0A9P0FN00_BRAAE|nr:unnamed protein product [Brassicogethes aeneus]
MIRSVLKKCNLFERIKNITCANRPKQIMEGVPLDSRKRLAEFYQSPSPKKTHFVGLTPLKELTNISSPSNRPFRVSIEGNIGAGKSTLIKYFEGFEGIETNAEPIDWWRNLDGYNLLDLLYKDINEWCRVFQSYVFLTRLKLQSAKPKNSSTTVQMFERSVQNNRFCFLEQARQSGYLKGADYAVLDQWYRWARSNVDINLDLIVYLRSTPDVVYERVKSRARPEENTISLEYLTQLHDSHEKWLMTEDERFNTVPVLVLDADKTRDEVLEQYRLNEGKILGHDKKGTKHITKEDKSKVKKTLDLD